MTATTSSSRPACRNDHGLVPGLEEGNASTITTLDNAIHVGEAWRRFLDAPGPIVVGATQGADCFGAAYEFLFSVAYQLKKAGLESRRHFGIGGLPTANHCSTIC